MEKSIIDYDCDSFNMLQIISMLDEARKDARTPDISFRDIYYTNHNNDIVVVGREYDIIVHGPRRTVDTRRHATVFAYEFELTMEHLDGVQLTGEMSYIVVRFITWLRNHDQDILAGFFKPTLHDYYHNMSSQLTSVVSKSDAPTAITSTAVPMIDPGVQTRGLKRKPRFTSSRMNQLDDKLKSMLKKLQALKEDYPGINRTNTWKDWRDLFEDELESSSCDDSDTNSVDPSGQPEKRLSLGRLNAPKRKSLKRPK